MIKNVFGFAKVQEKATNGIGYKTILTRRKYESLLNKIAGIADARNKSNHILRYVPHYTPSIPFNNNVFCLNKL